MACFFACFGFPKRAPVIDGPVEQPSSLECQALSPGAAHCGAFSMSGCERIAWVASTPPQRTFIKVQTEDAVDAVDAFNTVMSAGVQLRRVSSEVLSTASHNTEPSSGATQTSASPNLSPNFLHPSAGRHTRRSTKGMPIVPRPYASASAPIFKIEVPPDSDAWVPAPKQQQAAIAPLLLVDNEAATSNQELGEFYESMLLSMQIRLKVDAELSSFRHLPSASSARFIARLSMGQNGALVSAAASATPSGAWHASGTGLVVNNSNAIQRAERRYVGSLDWSAPPSGLRMSLSPSQAAAGIASPAGTDTSNPTMSTVDGGPQLPLTADCPQAVQLPAAGRASDHAPPIALHQNPYHHSYLPPHLYHLHSSISSSPASGRHLNLRRSNSIGRSAGANRGGKTRTGSLRPLQAADLAAGLVSQGSRTGTLPSSTEGQPLGSTTQGGLGEERTTAVQLVSEERAEGPGGAGGGLWQEHDLEPAVDIATGATPLPPRGMVPFVESRGAAVKNGGGGGAGFNNGGTARGDRHGLEGWAEVSPNRLASGSPPAPMWAVNGQGHSPSHVPGPPWTSLSPDAVAGAVTASLGGDDSYGEAREDGSGGGPIGNLWEQQQQQQQLQVTQGQQPQHTNSNQPHHHSHSQNHHHYYHHSRSPYSGIAGLGTGGRMLRPIPEFDTMSAKRLHQRTEGNHPQSVTTANDSSFAPAPTACKDPASPVPPPSARSPPPASAEPPVSFLHELEPPPSQAQNHHLQVKNPFHPRQLLPAAQPQQPVQSPQRCGVLRSGPRRKPSDGMLAPLPRAASWYGGAPAIHPDPTRVAPEVPVEMRLCHAAAELLEGLSDVRPLTADGDGETQEEETDGAVPIGIRPQEQRQAVSRPAGRQSATTGAKVAGGWFAEPLEGHAAGTTVAGSCEGSKCRSVVLQGRWQGHPVAVKIVMGSELEPRNGALISAIAAAAAVHSGLVRVYGIRLLPAGAVSAVECRGLAKAVITAGEATAAVVAAAALKPGEGVLAVIMELCVAGSLEPLVRAVYSPFRPNRSWPAYMARRALLQTALEIAGGLAYLHRYGLAHGGLRPANVLRVPALQDRRKFCAKVADFSLSRSVLHHSPISNPLLCYASAGGSNRSGSETNLRYAAVAALALIPSPGSSASQLPKQSPAAFSPPHSLPLPLTLTLRPEELLFVAPEALLEPGRLLVSPQADVFAFGMLLWALAAAQTSWDSELLLLEGGAAAAATISAGSALGGHPRPIPAWPSGAHPQLRNLYESCVKIVPEERPNMDQVVSDLKQLDEGLRNERPKNRAAAAAGYAALVRPRSGCVIPGFML